MTNRFLFVMNGPTSNRGCEAILLSTYRLLKEVFPTADFVNSSFRDPRVNKQQYLNLPQLSHNVQPKHLSLSGIYWHIVKRLFGRTYYFEHFLPSADFVLSLGGDNYSMDYGCAHTYFRGNEIILRAGKKLVLWGCSVGPFGRDTTLEHYAAEHLQSLFKIVVRESRSKAYLASIGVSDNVVLLPDPAFSLHPEPVVLSDELEDILTAGAIGLNLSPLLARYRTKPEQWVDEAAAMVCALLEKVEEPIMLVPHVMQPGNDDADFMTAIADRLSDHRERVHQLPGRDLSSGQLKHVISRLRLFIGARTHATIAALSSNVPTLSIGYSVKAQGINEDIFGNDEWVLDHLTMTPESFTGKVIQLLNSRLSVVSKLKKNNATYRITPENLSAIFKIG